MAGSRRTPLVRELPHDMLVEIAARVAATSPHPMEDICSLRATYALAIDRRRPNPAPHRTDDDDMHACMHSRRTRPRFTRARVITEFVID